MELVEVFNRDKRSLLAKEHVIVSSRIGVVNDEVLGDLKVGVTLVEVLVGEAFLAIQSHA